MSYLGIDYGEKKIGLAISEGFLSQPLAIISYTNVSEAIDKIKKICDRETVEKIIIGFPQSDQQSIMTQKITAFAKTLEKTVQLPIVFQDETLTSQEAWQKMKVAGKSKTRRQREDDFAAAIILQDYLDSKDNKL